MARRKGGAHPGLVEYGNRDAVWSKDFLEAPDFQSLGYEQKEFLVNYVKYRDAKRAAYEMGKTMEWVHEQEEVSTGFNDMVLQCMHHPHDLFTAILSDLVPQAGVVLYEAMNQTKSDRLRFDAAKEVLSLAGVGVQEGGSSLVNLNIEMFGKKEEVIELSTDIKVEDD